MKLEIETKFNLGQECWYVHKHHQIRIRRVKVIGVEVEYGSRLPKEKISLEIEYTVEGAEIINNFQWVEVVTEDNLFSSLTKAKTYARTVIVS